MFLLDNAKRHTPPSCRRSPPQHQSRTTPPIWSSASSTSNAGLCAALAGSDACRGSPSIDPIATGGRSSQNRFAQTPPSPLVAGRTVSQSPAPCTAPHSLDSSLSPRLTVVQPRLDASREVELQPIGPFGRAHRSLEAPGQDTLDDLQDQLQVRACPKALRLHSVCLSAHESVPMACGANGRSVRRVAVLTRRPAPPASVVVRSGRRTRQPSRTHEQGK